MSKVLLDLYRYSRELPIGGFQKGALERVKNLISFDSALWGTGALAGEGPVVYSVYIYHQPRSLLESWWATKVQNVVATEVFAHPGKTVNVRLSDPLYRERKLAKIRAHYRRFRISHILATAVPDPALNLSHFAALYRHSARHPFQERERLIKQELMPHLVQALNANRAWHVEEFRQPLAARRRLFAVTDMTGVVQTMESAFMSLMRSQWPDWSSPRLPPPLLAALVEKRQDTYFGAGIAVHARQVDDLLFLSARTISSIDRLSKRELLIAQQFSKGMSYKEIAQSLQIAPATVRNHLQSIYAKLSVGSRIDLISHVNEIALGVAGA